MSRWLMLRDQAVLPEFKGVLRVIGSDPISAVHMCANALGEKRWILASALCPVTPTQEELAMHQLTQLEGL